MKQTRMGKGLALLLALTLVFSCASTVSAAAAVTEKVSLGGNACSLVWIPMDGSVTGELTLGSDSANKDMAMSDHIARKKAQGGKSLVAAINGGLFNAYYDSSKPLSYPGNCARIYAVLLMDGQSVKGAGETPMLGFTSDGKALIDRVKVDVSVEFRCSDKVACWGVNDYYTDPSAVALFTGRMGYPVSLAQGAVLVYIKGGIVTSVVQGATGFTVPADGTQIVVYNSAAWSATESYNMQPRPGNSAVVSTGITPRRAETAGQWAKVTTGVGCGPWLLQGGKDVTADNAEFDDPKMAINAGAARSFAAVMPDGRLLLGAATASFRQITDYLISIGAVDAMALDGGASSALYAEGQGYLRNPGRKLSNVLHIVDYTGSLPAAPVAADIHSASNWAAEYISRAQLQGLIPQNFDLAAKENITRMEFCQLADALLQKQMGDSYSTELYLTGISYDQARANLSDTWDMAVINCYRFGIIDGVGGGKFDPNGSLTRQQAAKILANTAKLAGIDADGESVGYVDQSAFASWAVEGIDFVSRSGIMNGMSGGQFVPEGYFTKEQTIKTIVVMDTLCQ